jgi:hypothetical protein
MTTYVCSTDFTDFLNTTIVPLMAYAAVATSFIIALAYMIGSAMGNARLTLWSKTEIIQLLISVGTLFLIMLTTSTMCAIDMNEVATIFGQTPSATPVNVYDAAVQYLNDSAIYSHNAMMVVRYHLEGYTILAYLNAFKCDFNTGFIGWGCLFGYSGTNQQPVGGYGARMAAMNVFFNSLIVAYFTDMNSIFILMFVYRGFVFLFLPLGVFLRAMPYMRSFGALLIALALSFLVIYPFMLGVFYLMEGTLVNKPTFAPSDIPLASYNENVYPNGENAAAALQAATTVSSEQVEAHYFDPGKINCNGQAGACALEQPAAAIGFAADAFIAAVFLPSVALLATIASVAYIARLYGEEIDLSRLTQLV